MQSDLSDTGNMVLTLLWLGAAVFAAALWRRRPPVAFSTATVIELCLLGVGACYLLSAERSRYRFPGRIIAWEWAGYFAVFFTVRQVATSGEARQGLVAVLLAGLVSLSAHAFYQETVELPDSRARFQDRDLLRQELARRKILVESDDPYLVYLQKRALENHVFGTYAHPNSFAGYLVLLLPALLGAAFLSRTRPLTARTVVAGACALLGLGALWLTHSRGAMLALVIVATAVGCGLGRRWLWAHKGWAAVGVLVAVAAGYALYALGAWSRGIGKDEGTVSLRLLYWRTTARIIGEHPWLGVGPGNFRGAYAQHMEENAEEKIADPHNFALEAWSSGGLFALLGLLAALGALYVGAFRLLRAPATATEPTVAGPPSAPRWDLYVGGMAGLLVGFILRVGGESPDVMLGETIAAGMRALVWFAALAVFEALSWPAWALGCVLTAGLTALLLNLAVSGGIAFSSVAALLWAVAALVLSPGQSGDEPGAGRTNRRQLLVLPACVVLALIYLVFVFIPVATSAAQVQKAASAGLALQEQLAARKGPALRHRSQYLQEQVIRPLQEATRLTPDDARAWARLVPWYGELWRLKLQPGAESADAKEQARHAVEAATIAQRLDPQSPQGYLAEHHLRLSFARQMEEEARRAPAKDAARLKEMARDEHRRAAEVLGRYLPHDPTDLNLRYLRARALAKAGDKEAAQEQAEAILALDAQTGRSTRRLTDPQRQDLQMWARGQPPG